MNGDCLFLFLTEGCDQACQHCYVSASPLRDREMSRVTVAQALELAEGLGITDIRLTGGEPTHHTEFSQIAEEIFDRGFALGLTTNGKRLLSEPAIERTAKQCNRCWISAYGPTNRRHQAIGGRAAVPLADLIRWVAEHSGGGAIGLSVLLTPGSCLDVVTLLDNLATEGVSRVRFIPAQPDGRAGHKGRFQWSGWPDEVRRLHVRLLELKPGRKEFTHLSLNNPFDFKREFDDPTESCLVRRRGMWSIVPDGRVYPCCYTVYERSQEIGCVGDPDLKLRMVSGNPCGPAARCRALKSDFWPGSTERRVSCPISTAQLTGKPAPVASHG